MLDTGTPNERPNPHATAGKPYETITISEIAKMVEDPPSVLKTEARWFIPSNYCQHDARDHKVQAANGLFWWLVLDSDHNNLSLAEINAYIDAAVGEETSRLVYATRSATPEDRRWRGLVPLKVPLPGEDYKAVAEAFFGRLRDVSLGTLLPDPRLALTGQLVYLPNKGDHYEFDIRKGTRLDLLPGHPIIRQRDEERRKAEPSIRKIFSQWLTADALAQNTASKIITRYVDIPSEATFRLDAKDRSWWVGETVTISHHMDVDAWGQRRLRNWTIVSAEEVVPGEVVEYLAEDTTLYGKIHYIMAPGAADYPGAALAPFKNAYIGNSAGLLSDGSTCARIS